MTEGDAGHLNTCDSLGVSPLELGTCKWFNKQRGYGFIIPDSTDRGFGDVFFHATTLSQCGITEIDQGDRVRYDLKIVNEKRSAVNIVVLPRKPVPWGQPIPVEESRK